MERRKLQNDAVTEICRGMKRMDIRQQLWKTADLRDRTYVDLNDMAELLDIHFYFAVLVGKKASTGLVQGVGYYFDRLPKQLVRAYEKHVEEAEQLGMGKYPVLVFRMPFLKTGVAIMREGGLAENPPGHTQLVYTTTKTQYVIESARTFGMEILSTQ